MITLEHRQALHRRRAFHCGWIVACVTVVWLVALAVLGTWYPSSRELLPLRKPGLSEALWHDATTDSTTAPVLVSYSYFEKDNIQRSNFEYFLATGTHYPQQHEHMHWVFVISGDVCSPCKNLNTLLRPLEGDLSKLGIQASFASKKFTLLMRSENVGMDVAAHNITLEFMSWSNKLTSYKYFILLNSSVKGPFFPSYMPQTWHWSHAYLTRLTGDIHAVSSSLVCLPEADAGGPGPRLESWAFALDTVGLQVCIDNKVFHIRTCKLCSDRQGIVVGGEYGISMGMFKAGYNIATLMSKYAAGVDWRNPQNWHCNNNVHPSRHGTYDGISFHPYETVFVKSSWHVADPYTKRYARWHLNHLIGNPGTEGKWDEAMYKYAVSVGAQVDPNMEAAYRVNMRPMIDGRFLKKSVRA